MGNRNLLLLALLASHSVIGFGCQRPAAQAHQAAAPSGEAKYLMLLHDDDPFLAIEEETGKRLDVMYEDCTNLTHLRPYSLRVNGSCVIHVRGHVFVWDGTQLLERHGSELIPVAGEQIGSALFVYADGTYRIALTFR